MHTQGPWQIDAENAGGGFNIRDAMGARIAHTMEVAKYADGGPVTSDEAKDNAVLAAAAPEMLEALRCAQVALLQNGLGCHRVIDLIDSAVAKATRSR